MKKKRLIFRGPVLTASGYGVHSRMILRSLMERSDYDISVVSTPWGHCPILRKSDPFLDSVRKLIVQQPTGEFDVSVQITIPNEFQRLAKFNICITAGIETNMVSPEWIVKTNEMADMLLVPSNHSADVFRNTMFRDNTGKEFKLQKPITVLFEGVNTDVFNTKPLEPGTKVFDFPTKFNFITVGLGFDKAIGEDRKNLSALVRWFSQQFKDDKDVGLILKCSIVSHSAVDFKHIKNRIAAIKREAGVGEFPRIYLVHGHLEDEEMARLYKMPNTKAYITLTHGEGYGLPIIEAAACGLPVVATDWSGHLDFLSINGTRKFVAVPYDLKQIPESCVWDGVLHRESKWANPREEDAKRLMAKLVMSYDKPKQWATDLAAHIAENFSEKKMNEEFQSILDFCDTMVKQKETEMETQGTNVDDFIKKQRIRMKEKYGKTLLYTMPGAGGDVYMSTGIISNLKKKHPDCEILFATEPQYRSILKGHPDIRDVLKFDQWMMDNHVAEKIFDEVYQPNLQVQLRTSNWVHGGKGRTLGAELAAQCQVEFGEPVLRLEAPSASLPEKYIVLHTTSGQANWSSRRYLRWQEVVDNLRSITGLPVVQVGLPDEPLLTGVVDYRGKTQGYNQLAYVVKNARLVVATDSVVVHLAAGLGTPHVSLYGNTYANSTKPTNSKVPGVYLEPEKRYTCEKACFAPVCFVDADMPCSNEVHPSKIVEEAAKLLGISDIITTTKTPSISGYTTVFNGESNGYPYIECVKSMLGFCDEVVVVDGMSDDGTYEKLKTLADVDLRIKLFQRKFDVNQPDMDGNQKQFARSQCTTEFLWQQDADEVVHESDYQKIRKLVWKMPTNADLLHLPVIELWNSQKNVRTDRHSWKWRFSRNRPEIVHGINKHARVENDGKVLAKKGMSDGCEYIHRDTLDFYPHFGYYNQQIEQLRQQQPPEYGKVMNRVFNDLPSVYHYSWASVERKIRNFRDFWDKMWGSLYGEEHPDQRFFVGKDMKSITEQDIKEESERVAAVGGENPAPLFTLQRTQPAVMTEWLKRNNVGE